jgi:dTDP-4-dehydrorhamnose reductase
MMKVLILGGDGMLAYAIKQAFSFCTLSSLGRNVCDITNPQKVEAYVQALRPNVLINCAAYTNVDKAEAEPDLCELVNTTAVEALAHICKKYDIVLVQFSTEMVFGQEIEGGYKESDEPLVPLNVYGRTKLKAEQHIKQTWDKHYIIRTSWMFGPNGDNFIDKIMSKGLKERTIEVVNDQLGSPTYTFDVARAVFALIVDVAPYGIYHLVNNGITTRANFAYEIFDYTNIFCEVNQIPSSSVHTAAQRPKHGILLNTKRITLPQWYDAMVEYLVGKGVI